MGLHIASEDKGWLNQTVLAERTRLASLHKAAVLNGVEQTDQAVEDHKEELDRFEESAKNIQGAPKEDPNGLMVD